jgi:hypothetical protein
VVRAKILTRFDQQVNTPYQVISFNIMNGEERQASDRTALLIYCTREEAQHIRIAAKRERRTISGFVMNAVMTRLGIQFRIQKKAERKIMKDVEPAS